MKKLCIALMMGLSLVVLDASAATKTCDKDGQYVKGAGKTATCEFCPDGYYCPDKKNKKKCPAGSFCPGHGKKYVTRETGDGKWVWQASIGVSDGTKSYPCEGNKYSTAGQASCKRCDGANQIVNSNHTGCIKCSAKQQPNADHTACEKIESTNVDECQKGQYVKGVGKNKICPECEDGYYCPDGKKRQKCPAGSYCRRGLSIFRKGNAGAIKPTPCTGNTYSTPGQSNCKKCDGANQIVNSNHTGCKNCPAKQQPNADHTQCVKA